MGGPNLEETADKGNRTGQREGKQKIIEEPVLMTTWEKMYDNLGSSNMANLRVKKVDQP